MRALIVGLGSAGRRHARNWAELGLGELLVCRTHGTPQPEPLGVAAREFRDLDEALSTQPDLVVVTNPTSMHVETAHKAVEAGAHVLIEKPISHQLNGLVELLSAAAAHERHIGVGYNLRFHPGLQRARELLHGGAIGRPLSVRCEMGEYLPGWHPWEDYRQSYSGRADLGGGPVLTFSHELDSLLWLLGPPTHIAAMSAHASALEISTEDVAEIVVRLRDNVLASVHVDYVRRPPRRYIEITGEHGVLRWEFDANRVLHYDAAVSTWRTEEGDPRFARNAMFMDELRSFVNLTRGQDRDVRLCNAEQGAAVLSVALAALQSAAEGRSLAMATMGEAEQAWLTSFERPNITCE